MPTTALTNLGWRIQLAIHRAVRRDVTRLSVALDSRAVPAQVVRTYWGETAMHLHHHHRLEDTVVWPLLGERLGARVVRLLARNEREHQVMGAAMETFDAALRASTANRLAAQEALGCLHEAIEIHLAHEEADVLPLIPVAFTIDDIATFRAEDAKTNAPRAFLPWLLDDAPEEDLVFFTVPLPAPVRAQLDSDWMPQRQQIVEELGVACLR